MFGSKGDPVPIFGRTPDEERELAAERAEQNAREIERMEELQEESGIDLTNQIGGPEAQTQDDIAIASDEEPSTG
jgi:hypothetical protein